MDWGLGIRVWVRVLGAERGRSNEGVLGPELRGGGYWGRRKGGGGSEISGDEVEGAEREFLAGEDGEEHMKSFIWLIKF